SRSARAITCRHRRAGRRSSSKDEAQAQVAGGRWQAAGIGIIRPNKKTASCHLLPAACHLPLMIYRPLIALALAVSLPAFSAGDAAAGAKKNFQCQGCHGVPGWKTAFPEIYSV